MRASTCSVDWPRAARTEGARWTHGLRARAAACLFAVFALALAWPAHAHKASDAYLQLSAAQQGVDLRWDIALRDLDAALDLDRNGDRRLSWGEVTSRIDDILAYALTHLSLQPDCSALALREPPAVEDRIDGAYLVLRLQTPCSASGTLSIDYRLFREIDPTHRGLLRIDRSDAVDAAPRSLDPSGGPVVLRWGTRSAEAIADDARTASAIGASRGFFRDGMHHILIGWDHLLFLLSLLLPAVLRRGAGGRRAPVERWREALWPMLGIVSSFTLAHSLTLALAATHVVELSPRIVEPAIAVTIVLAAIDNFRPLLGGRRKLFCFFFGLVHGFGFAGALAELDLPVRGFVLALLQFNLGVEAGQLLVVCVATGVLMTLRHWPRYEGLVLKGGSVAALAMAGVWFVERAFDIALLPA